MILNEFGEHNLLGRSRAHSALSACIQRTHVQPTRRAKLFAPKPPLLEVRNQTHCFCPAQPALHCHHSICVLPCTSSQRETEWKNGVARTSRTLRLEPFDVVSRKGNYEEHRADGYYDYHCDHLTWSRKRVSSEQKRHPIFGKLRRSGMILPLTCNDFHVTCWPEGRVIAQLPAHLREGDS